MALLVEPQTGQTHTLSAHTLLGRSSACAIRFRNTRISGEHARLSWDGRSWRVRDLGSRNGTFVNGQKLALGASVELSEGDRLAFGSEARAFKLVDASAPVAFARRPDTGELERPSDGLLALPSEQRPLACLVQGGDGGWTLEVEGEARPIEDGELLAVDGVAWVLHLPTPGEPTAEAPESAPGGPPALRFRVSRDEETVEVMLQTQEGPRVLAPRAHHYTLLTLARVRLAEAGTDLPEPARGWLTVEEACRMLAVDEMRLNVEIYRIRRDLKRLGIRDAASVIERRKRSRQLRLAWRDVRIEPSR